MDDSTTTRVPLYERLPEIYRIKDAEQHPPGQLEAYLSLVEEVFGAVDENIEALYDDLFIETCADWVIPYVGDLLGTSHLKGDPWTLRADVADTIALRRRKGTRSSIERLVFNLTRWGVHTAELRERLAWNQHLNHQRPDTGGVPPYSQATFTMRSPVWGGTVPLRDPALLSLLPTPFNPFAHLADVRPASFGQLRHNLPNLAIFLWRLADYRVMAGQPTERGVHAISGAASDEATHAARFDVHPLGRPVRLFNTFVFDPDQEPPVVAELDATPGPILTARLTEDTEAGRPERYVAIDTYDPVDPSLDALDVGDGGLVLHLPADAFGNPDEDTWPSESSRWTIRGANLCAWEEGLQPALREREMAIDPVIGRVVFGTRVEAEAEALRDGLLITYTYGAVGPVGAHPISRDAPPPLPDSGEPEVQPINLLEDPATTLQDVLATVHEPSAPDVIEIRDSLTRVLDVSAVEAAMPAPDSIHLGKSLTLRAGDGQRPVIRLTAPLRFRSVDVENARNVSLRLEGLFLTRADDFPANEPLIARAALNRIEFVGCTLDPGGHHVLDGTPEGSRAPMLTAVDLREPYGFSDDEENAFDQTPEVVLRRTVSGSLRIDRGYTLHLIDSILDAGVGVGDVPDEAFALTSATDPTSDYGPPTEDFRNVTVFGRMRVEHIHGQGGLFVHALEVLNNQRGCLKYSYFAPETGSLPSNRLPQNVGCVRGEEAHLQFTSEVFGTPGYAQLARTSDFRIRERGPEDDAMGAFNFLLEAHKWRNLQIRFREFMPVGVRPLLVPVT